MTASAFDLLSSQLLSTSLSSAAVAAAVWLACRCVPGLPAAARATLWWLVALKLLVGLVWVTPIALPILPSTAAAVLAVPASMPTATGTLPPSTSGRGVEHSATAQPSGSALTWRRGVVLVWLAVLVVLAARFAWQLRQSLRLIARAAPAAASINAAVRDAGRCLGMAHVPPVCASDDIAAPLLVGLHHPRIIVPRDRFAALSAAQQRMALGHELAHHRRRDLWFGLVPALAERLFFFHPVARLAAREYLVAREAACDAEVVAALDVNAHDYARLLLTLGVAPMPPRFAAAGASRSVSNLKRRIVMLGLPSPTRKVRAAGWAVAAIAVCAVVPVRLVGRAVDVRVPATDGDTVGRPAPAIAVVAVASREIAQTPQKPVITRERGRVDYALVLGDSTMMSGAISSQRLAALRGSSPRLLWFRADGREYVVRDEAAIARAVEITRPIREIGAAQGEVGSRQGAIGAQQGEVGARQGSIGARQGAIGARQAEIGARQAALAARDAGAPETQRQQLDRQRAELDEQMRKLDDQMGALDDEMRRADEPMADLDAKMRVLDDEMRALDVKMHEAEPRVRAALQALFERLVAEKIAEPAK
jgi:beta-lactamase regulating signal transducer with metallopeptidase domain